MPNHAVFTGDILRDRGSATQIAGSVGLAGSANIGREHRRMSKRSMIGRRAAEQKPGPILRDCCWARQ